MHELVDVICLLTCILVWKIFFDFDYFVLTLRVAIHSRFKKMGSPSSTKNIITLLHVYSFVPTCIIGFSINLPRLQIFPTFINILTICLISLNLISIVFHKSNFRIRQFQIQHLRLLMIYPPMKLSRLIVWCWFRFHEYCPNEYNIII